MSTRIPSQMKAAPVLSFTPAQTGLLQRKCACGGTPGLDGECEECRKKRLTMQRRAITQGEPTEVPPIVREVVRSPGQPLDSPTRAFMESRFGHSFSRVRVHSDARAAESARAVSASAYTVGQDVVFAAGQYQPGTMAGSRLLAHELAHVVQQGRSPRPIDMMPAGVMIAGDDRLEREAERAAAHIGASQNVFVSSGRPAPGLQRQVGPGQTPQADDCSGWENDPESFSKKVADHFVRTQINPPTPPSAESIECTNPPNGSYRNCEVTYSEELRIAVRWNTASNRVAADWDHGKKVCLYEYTCDAQGQLILKLRECRERQQG